MEDVSSHLMPIFRFTPTCALQCGYHPQGVEGTCKGEFFQMSDSGKSYDFNTADMLHSLLVKPLVLTGVLVDGGTYAQDFGHQFIGTEKYAPRRSIRSLRTTVPALPPLAR